jgi:hypothetical protein
MAEPTGEGLTFEKVWAMFQETAKRAQETDRQLKETDKQLQENSRQMAENDRRMRERMEETDRFLKESKAETDRALKEASRMVGDLGNKFGRLAEHLVVPNMMKKFNALGYEFTRTSRNIKILGADKKPLTEIDGLLENGQFAIVAEIKADFTVSHVGQHVERMEKLRRYWDEHNDKRKLIGAVAGAIMEDRVKALALDTGFYVIVQSGDTLKIEAPQGFTPRIW